MIYLSIFSSSSTDATTVIFPINTSTPLIQYMDNKVSEFEYLTMFVSIDFPVNLYLSACKSMILFSFRQYLKTKYMIFVSWACTHTIGWFGNFAHFQFFFHDFVFGLGSSRIHFVRDRPQSLRNSMCVTASSSYQCIQILYFSFSPITI